MKSAKAGTVQAKREARSRRRREHTSVSLNIETREREREELDARKLALENARREARGLEPLASLEDMSEDEIPDVQLNEAAEVVVDLMSPEAEALARIAPPPAPDSDDEPFVSPDGEDEPSAERRQQRQEVLGLVRVVVERELGRPGLVATEIDAETEAFLVQSVGDHLVETDEGPAADEQDVRGVDLQEILLWMLATALRRHRRRRPFDDLEQRLLNTFARHVTRDRRVLALARNLVDLVDVDDAPFGGRDVVVRGLEQAHQDVLHVLAHVAGLRQRRGVGDGEGHVEEARQGLGQQPVIDGPLGKQGDHTPFSDFIRQTARDNAQLQQQMHEGRDRLLEYNSCRPRQAAEICSRVTDQDEPGELIDYATRAFDCFGIEYQEHSDQCLVLKPGAHLQAASIPSLPADGMTVTVSRNIALANEDMQFLTWEHPMVRGCMEMLTSGELGTAAVTVCSHLDYRTGSALLEVLAESFPDLISASSPDEDPAASPCVTLRTWSVVPPNADTTATTPRPLRTSL